MKKALVSEEQKTMRIKKKNYFKMPLGKSMIIESKPLFYEATLFQFFVTFPGISASKQ
ncbi:MAG: hypothetical protein ROO71_06080 [Balneola sp.]